jgi:tetratricopeptide (TPR) repeat protein
LLAAAPGAISTTATNRATALRQRGELGRALAAAELGEAAAPFSLGAAMLAESLRFLTGDARDASVERLLDLADRYPGSARPVTRAAWLLEQEAADPAAWAVIAQLRAEAVRRDPLSIGERIQHALALLRAGDQRAAEAALEGALQVEPHCAVAHAHLALLLDRAGDRDAARRHAADAWQAHAARLAPIPRAAQILSLPEDLARMLRERGLVES